MKLLCGHNICRSCLNKYSSSEHPKSSVRCEVCQIETKVVLLSISIPNRAVCQILIDVQVVLGRKFYSGAIRYENSQNAREELKAEKDRIDKDEDKMVDYASRDPMAKNTMTVVHGNVKTENSVERKQNIQVAMNASGMANLMSAVSNLEKFIDPDEEE